MSKLISIYYDAVALFYKEVRLLINFKEIVRRIPGGKELIIQRTTSDYKFITNVLQSRGFFGDPGEESSVEITSDINGNVMAVVLLRYMSQSGYKEIKLEDPEFEENFKECSTGNTLKFIMKDLMLQYRYEINRMEIGDMYRLHIHEGPYNFDGTPSELRYKFIKNELEVLKEGVRFYEYCYY